MRVPQTEEPMSDTVKLSCKNRRCGAPLSFDVQIFSSNVTLRAGDNVKFESHLRRGVEVVCKECCKTAATIRYDEMTD